MFNTDQKCSQEASAEAGVMPKVVRKLEEAERLPGIFTPQDGKMEWSFSSAGYDYRRELPRREAAFERMKKSVEPLLPKGWTIERGIDYDGVIRAVICPFA
jgi:hypothetical protein